MKEYLIQYLQNYRLHPDPQHQIQCGSFF